MSDLAERIDDLARRDREHNALIFRWWIRRMCRKMAKHAAMTVAAIGLVVAVSWLLSPWVTIAVIVGYVFMMTRVSVDGVHEDMWRDYGDAPVDVSRR